MVAIQGRFDQNLYFPMHQLFETAEDSSENFDIKEIVAAQLSQGQKSPPPKKGTYLNWANLFKGGLLTYLLGEIAKVDAATYVPEAPFAVSTQTFNNAKTCAAVQLNNTNVAYTWTDNADFIYKRMMNLTGQAVTPQSTVISTGQNWEVHSMPFQNGSLRFWTNDESGVRPAYQQFDRNDQSVGGLKTFEPIMSSDNNWEVYPAKLGDGRIATVYVNRNSSGWDTFQVILSSNTADPISSPNLVTNFGTYQRFPFVVERNSGWVDFLTVEGDVYQQLYDSNANKEGSLTPISTTAIDSVTRLHPAVGMKLSNGNGYIGAWAKRDIVTSDVLGYYYRRFHDNGTAIDGSDQILKEGNLGKWISNPVIHFIDRPDERIELLSHINDTIQMWTFSPLGIAEGNLTLPAIGVRGICGTKLQNGYTVGWTNSSGFFSQYWIEQISPTTGTTGIQQITTAGITTGAGITGTSGTSMPGTSDTTGISLFPTTGSTGIGNPTNGITSFFPSTTLSATTNSLTGSEISSQMDSTVQTIGITVGATICALICLAGAFFALRQKKRRLETVVLDEIQIPSRDPESRPLPSQPKKREKEIYHNVSDAQHYSEREHYNNIPSPEENSSSDDVVIYTDFSEFSNPQA